MLSKPLHLTVVYTIHDEQSFAEECERIISLFKESLDGVAAKAWCITALSNDHEIHRQELLEVAIDRGDLITAANVLAHADIGNISSLDNLS